MIEVGGDFGGGTNGCAPGIGNDMAGSVNDVPKVIIAPNNVMTGNVAGSTTLMLQDKRTRCLRRDRVLNYLFADRAGVDRDDFQSATVEVVFAVEMGLDLKAFGLESTRLYVGT